MAIALWDGRSDDKSWQVVKLNGVVLPGKTTLSVNAGGGLAETKAPNNQGAFLTDEGVGLSSVEISILLLNQQDVDQFNQTSTFFFPQSTKARRSPMPIEHPATQLAGIDQVVWDEKAVPSPTAQAGITINISLKEYQEPEKTTKAKKPRKVVPKDSVDAVKDAMKTKEQANSGGNQ